LQNRAKMVQIILQLFCNFWLKWGKNQAKLTKYAPYIVVENKKSPLDVMVLAESEGFEPCRAPYEPL
ncbi:MAG: hypothetical protein IJZ77_02900, partial [Bacilli bacterium]|nr:hypothetical protein [Bacilli bacterium]